MADKDTNVPNKNDFISREAAIKEFCDDCMDREWCKSNGDSCSRIKNINAVSAADVVARDCYDRILAENDTMRKQLAQIGKKPGDKMDDVRAVVQRDAVMQALNKYFSIGDSDTYELTRVKEAFYAGTMTLDDFEEWNEDNVSDLCDYLMKELFGPTCGAEMEKMITGKEANGRT